MKDPEAIKEMENLADKIPNMSEEERKAHIDRLHQQDTTYTNGLVAAGAFAASSQYTNSAFIRGFIDHLVLREHRTLQQSAFRFVMKLVYAWAGQEQFDMRNASTVQVAKKIKEIFGEYGPDLPFI
jgi:hypothetical protein